MRVDMHHRAVLVDTLAIYILGMDTLHPLVPLEVLGKRLGLVGTISLGDMPHDFRQTLKGFDSIEHL